MTKVLIIDDEKSILESLSSVLIEEGFEVRTAKDGKEGLALFEEMKPRIVLLDIWMPEMDGLEVLSRVKETGSGSRGCCHFGARHGLDQRSKR